MTSYTPLIGMEVHVELKTTSKMFCGCKNDPFFAREPNIYTCPVCLGMPGGLPVPNKKAVEWTIMLGLALNCSVPLLSKFDRKNYFYPDLAKGYQISQYDQPLCLSGKVAVDGADVRIRRVHLEEDTGKLLHTKVDGQKVTLIDFNRSGVPLVEIVAEPDIHSGDEAKAFLKKLQQIIRYLEVSDADLEKGSLRLEPNISLQSGSDKGLPDYKVEVKNINSFNFVKRAIDYEISRQKEILQKNETPVQETRGWNAARGITVSQRRKEEADDYRYFPEPDIPPMRWNALQISKLKTQITELPEAKIERFIKDYGLNAYDAGLLTQTAALADYFEECLRVVGKMKGEKLTAKHLANWLINRQIDIEKILPTQLVRQISQATPTQALSEKQLGQMAQQIIKDNVAAASDYRAGKTQALMFLVGALMRKTAGQASATAARELLEKMLQ